MSTEWLVHLLLTFKYEALFFLVMVEGFFTTLTAGALAARGVLNLWAALLVIASADMASDFLFYTFGKKISKTRFAPILGLTPNNILRAEKLFTVRGPSTIIAAKLSSYLAIPVIVAAGAIHMPKSKFYKYCGIAAFIKAFGLLMLGYFFGQNIHDIVHALVIGSLGLTALLVIHWSASSWLKQVFARRVVRPKKRASKR